MDIFPRAHVPCQPSENAYLSIASCESYSRVLRTEMVATDRSDIQHVQTNLLMQIVSVNCFLIASYDVIKFRLHHALIQSTIMCMRYLSKENLYNLPSLILISELRFLPDRR